MKEINHRIFFNHPVDDVWDYLTKPELIELWLMKNNFKPEIGAEFQFWARPMPDHNFDGNIYCKVLELVPKQKISYTWKGGAGDGTYSLDSVVHWTLHPRDNGTELQIVHNGFKDVDVFMFNAMNDGWWKNINKISELLKK